MANQQQQKKKQEKINAMQTTQTNHKYVALLNPRSHCHYKSAKESNNKKNERKKTKNITKGSGQNKQTVNC